MTWRNLTNFLQNELSTKFRWLSRCLFSNIFVLLPLITGKHYHLTHHFSRRPKAPTRLVFCCFLLLFSPDKGKQRRKEKMSTLCAPKKSGKKKSPWRCLAKKMKKDISEKKIWKHKLGKKSQRQNFSKHSIGFSGTCPGDHGRAGISFNPWIGRELALSSKVEFVGKMGNLFLGGVVFQQRFFDWQEHFCWKMFISEASEVWVFFKTMFLFVWPFFLYTPFNLVWGFRHFCTYESEWEDTIMTDSLGHETPCGSVEVLRGRHQTGDLVLTCEQWQKKPGWLE